jgi:hypothetical protein
VILPNSDVIRLLFLQCLEKQIQRRLIIVVILFCSAVLDHSEHHFQSLFVRRGLMEKIQHKGRVEGNFGFLPKGIVLTGILRCGILNKVADEPEHVGVLADIAKGIVAVAVARLDEVKHLDNIPLL